MLHLPLKQTDKVDLHKSLSSFVEVAYSSEQADEHRNAFHEVDTLRERMRQAKLSESTAAETVRVTLRYYRLITAMSSRFGDVVESSAAWVPFTWHNAMKPGDKCSRPELQLEILCVLFNVAAALSYSATLEDCTTTTGLRTACQSFQYAQRY